MDASTSSRTTAAPRTLGGRARAMLAPGWSSCATGGPCTCWAVGGVGPESGAAPPLQVLYSAMLPPLKCRAVLRAVLCIAAIVLRTADRHWCAAGAEFTEVLGTGLGAAEGANPISHPAIPRPLHAPHAHARPPHCA
jgi:hypothetical protein